MAGRPCTAQAGGRGPTCAGRAQRRAALCGHMARPGLCTQRRLAADPGALCSEGEGQRRRRAGRCAARPLGRAPDSQVPANASTVPARVPPVRGRRPLRRARPQLGRGPLPAQAHATTARLRRAGRDGRGRLASAGGRAGTPAPAAAPAAWCLPGRCAAEITATDGGPHLAAQVQRRDGWRPGPD